MMEIVGTMKEKAPPCTMGSLQINSLHHLIEVSFFLIEVYEPFLPLTGQKIQGFYSENFFVIVVC